MVLGVSLAILHYEWTHYVAHIPYQPRTAWGRYIKRYHLRHHFISEKVWFGVSNPAFDYPLPDLSRSEDGREKSVCEKFVWRQK